MSIARLDGNATTEAAAAHRQMPPAQKPKSKVSPRRGFRYSAAATAVGSARTSTISLRRTLTPINMLVRDLDTVRVRNAIHAEILAILRGLTLRPHRRTN